jgi:hypothetical protein
MAEGDCHLFRCDDAFWSSIILAPAVSLSFTTVWINIRIKIESAYLHPLPDPRPIFIFQEELLRKEMQMVYLGALLGTHFSEIA